MIGVEAALAPPIDHRLPRAAEAIDAGAAGQADDKRRDKQKGRTLERGPADGKSGGDQKRMPMFAATALFFWFERPSSRV